MSAHPGLPSSRVPIPRRVLLALCAIAAIAGGPPGASADGTAAQAAIVLSIVGTNDLHGAVAPPDGRGGLALLAGYLENLRAARERDGGAVLLIDAGDMFQGTLESNANEGAVVVAAYNAIGYTAAAIGNHEFDFGPVGPASTPASPGDNPLGALKARAAEAAFPLLAANLVDVRTGRPVEWPNVQPSVLVERAGVKVGIVGVMTLEALSATIAANVVGLKVTPLAPAIAAAAARLREAGAQVVIVAAHAGTTCRDFANPADSSSCDRDGEIVQVARELPPSLVDVIVAGHVHAGVAHDIHGIAVVAAYANGRAFGRVDLQVDRARGMVVGRTIFPPRQACARVTADTGGCAPAGAPDTVAATYEGATVRASDRVQRLLAPALAVAERLKEEPVGAVLETPVRRMAGRDSPLGNLFTDALLHAVPGADVALHNTTGGLRADLPAGALNYGHVYEVMPFDNRLVVVALTGEQLRRVLESHLQRTNRRLGVAGVRVSIRCSWTGVQVELRGASGDPVQDDDTVRVVVGDFLATGGDEILTPILPPGGLAIEADGPLARDALAGYLRHLGKELREEDFLAPDEPRTLHRERLPVPCERAAIHSVFR